MPAFHVDDQAHVGYVLSSGGTLGHAVAPTAIGLLIETRHDGTRRLLGRSICDRKVEVRDLDERFDRDNPRPDFCKRCVAGARQLNGHFAKVA